jgi:hypothetical protein
MTGVREKFDGIGGNERFRVIHDVFMSCQSEAFDMIDVHPGVPVHPLAACDVENLNEKLFCPRING